MPLSRAAKKVKVETLAVELAGSTSAIIGTFAGLTASKDFELRKTVRAAGGSYHVVNNKLAAKASTGTKIEAALQGLKGVSSVAYTAGDPVALAKALSAWVKDNAEFTFKLGIVDGKVITVEDIGALATMPGKEELFSKLLFLIQSPTQRLVTVMNAAGRDLAVVINQAVEQEKFAASAAAPTSGIAPAVASSEAPAASLTQEAPQAEPVDATSSAKPAAVETPAIEVPAAEAPVAEVPAVEAPTVEVPVAEVPTSEASSAEAFATVDTASQVPAVETSAAETAVPGVSEVLAAEAPALSESPVAVDPSVELVAQAHAIEAPAADAEAPQPENGTASQAGEATSTDPVEGKAESVEG